MQVTSRTLTLNPATLPGRFSGPLPSLCPSLHLTPATTLGVQTFRRQRNSPPLSLLSGVRHEVKW